jgi:hypothetical protein
MENGGHAFYALKVQRKCYKCCDTVKNALIGVDQIVILSVDRQLREMGALHGLRWDVGSPRCLRNVRMEEQILEVVEESSISTRSILARTGTPHASVLHTLQGQQLYPYRLQSVQELAPHDATARHESCQWILRQSTEHHTFRVNVSFTYEPSFARTGITSIHNEHVWSHANAHAIRSHHQQRQFYITFGLEL